MKNKKRIAILGGGPSGLFIFKQLIETGRTDFVVEIFEKKNQLGAGMPYSEEGANDEHITNVSGNEIPLLVTSVDEWIQIAPKEILDRFKIDRERFNDYKVLPRLLFGQYLESQFNLLLHKAKESETSAKVHWGTAVTDIIDYHEQGHVAVETDKNETFLFDHIIICTGHTWPVRHERVIPNYFDSPYPPSKIAIKANHSIAIKGSSLTAIDAIRTLARHNGTFTKNADGKHFYTLSEDSLDFRLIMHSRSGLLPAVRFHLEDSHLSKDSVLSQEEISNNMAANEGFLSLDFVFEKNFKELLRDKEPDFYDKIRNMRLEEFVESMMNFREQIEPFQLFKAEYAEAEKSIKRKESVYWKEMLAVLSFAMNYPAKYFSAEDMQRLQKILMPLISIVIAFVPQSSVEEMLALHNAGVLDIISVGEDSQVEPENGGGANYHYINESGQPVSIHYKTFVDCVGQPHLSFKEIPFKSMLSKKTISQARLKFKDVDAGLQAKNDKNEDVVADMEGNYYLNVPGVAINDSFQIVDEYGAYNSRIFMMAVPYMAGYNPDYSGLDFCEAASARIVKAIF